MAVPASSVPITAGRGDLVHAEALHDGVLVQAEAGGAAHQPRPNDVLVDVLVDLKVVVYSTVDPD